MKPSRQHPTALPETHAGGDLRPGETREAELDRLVLSRCSSTIERKFASGSGSTGGGHPRPASLTALMGSLIKKRRKRMRKKKHKKMLKATRWQRRAGK